MKKIIAAVLALLAGTSVSAQQITLRHDLDGKALDTLATLTLRFNDEQKGKGQIRLQDARNVEDKQKLPQLALLDPDDSMAFFNTRPRFRPLYEVMQESGQKLDLKQFYPQILGAADDSSGRLVALPLGMALPALFTNRAALQKAGQDPDRPAATWWDLQKVAGALHSNGEKCPLTSARFAWVHLENISAQHGEPGLVRSGKAERVALNSLVNVKHLALLASWQKSQYFHYSGPGREGDQRFLSGECAMVTAPSSLYADARRAGIDVSVSPLPYYDDVRGARQDDVLPDGASLWVLAGHKKDENALAARFVNFLMRPAVQKEWVAATSYLPMTPVAVAALRESGSNSPSLLATAQRRLAAPLRSDSRLRHGPVRDKLRQFVGEEIDFVWATDRPAKEALDNAVRRVNAPDPVIAVTAVAGKR